MEEGGVSMNRKKELHRVEIDDEARAWAEKPWGSEYANYVASVLSELLGRQRGYAIVATLTPKDDGRPAAG